ncbi:MAG: DUF721 domain-containing protein [Rhodospirillales bacterium]|jgi:hypothetical protein|nr:DUF721 domain-containing protein [Rhodospirillales bacterium]
MEKSQENKKSFSPYVKRRGGKTKTIGQHVDKLTKRAFGKNGFAGGTIITQWSTIVGDNLASLSAPLRIVYPQGKRSGGTLYLRIASGSIAVELQHMEQILIQRINGHFGYRAVERVQLQQAPLPDKDKDSADIYKRERPPMSSESTQELNDSLSQVDDPELHAALERLGENILRPKK